MRAAVRVAPGRIELRELPDPELGAGEILVRIDRVALCGGDLNYFLDQQARPPEAPDLGAEGFVVCHEAAGAVVAAPGGSLAVGERVTIDPQVRCNRCVYCRSGAIELCTERRDMGYTAHGAAAGLVVLPAERVLRVPEGVPPNAAAATHGLASVLHALSRVDTEAVERALIVGPGPAGLMFGLALTALRPGIEITIAGHSSPRLVLARELGLTAFAVDRDDVEALRHRPPGSTGFDLIVETSGANEMREAAPLFARPGGTLLMYAGGAFRLDGRVVNRRQLRVVGSSGAGDEMETAIALQASGSVDLGRLLSHTFELEEIQRAFELALARPEERGDLVKAVVNVS